MDNSSENWTLIRRGVAFSKKGCTYHRSFYGTADVYAYSGPVSKKTEKLGFGVVIRELGTGVSLSSESLLVSGSGYVAEAVLKAAGLRDRARIAPVSAQASDVGAPIGIALNSHEKPEPTMLFYKK